MIVDTIIEFVLPIKELRLIICCLWFGREPASESVVPWPLD